MSKGSAPRPFFVSNEEYARRWDEIFAKESCPACASFEFETREVNGQTVKECKRCEHQWNKNF